MAEYRHDQISMWYDEETGYRGIIAIHDTTLGPALGGTRFWNYDSDFEAFVDVLRLSRGMTYKAAVAGLNLGGGKSVIIGDYSRKDRADLFRAHGRHVESLGGRYITAEDVGTSTTDMEYIKEETDHVVGLAGKSGDPSPVTAFGVYRGMRACALFRYGSDSLAGKLITVQGLGHVGYNLCKDLYEDGARLVVADIDSQKTEQVAREFRARVVESKNIYDVDADIFAPCALGAVINSRTIPKLKVDIIAGAANNQLADEESGDRLYELGIVYAPDYVINSGGLINVNAEIEGWTLEESRKKASEIYDTILHILELAKEERIPSYLAADRLAQRRIDEARARKSGGR